MSSRSFRLETRSRARDEIKRIMQTVEKVRKWEKIWIETGLSNHLKVYKWVPVRDEGKKEEEEKEQEEPAGKTEQGSEKRQNTLPEILPAKELSTSLEPAAQLSSGPPDLLLNSESNTHHPLSSGVKQGTSDGVQQSVDLEKRRERQKLKTGGRDTEDRPRSPH